MDREQRTAHAIGIEAGRIAAIVPDRIDLPNRQELPAGSILAPGLIDIQVNGGGGLQWNDDPSAGAARAIAAAHRRLGTAGILPTLITDTPDRMERAAAALAAPIEGVLGAHFEGPYLSPERPGVHRPDLLRRPDDEALAWLEGLPGRIPGPVIATIAPELFTDAELERMAGAGLLLSAGHSAASAAIRPGIRAYTHTFNAMPPIAGRAPGIAAASLLHESAYAGLIADGHHLAPETVRLLLRCKGSDRLILISDAMAPAGTSQTTFTLQGRTIHRREGRLTTEAGTLAGADIALAGAVRYMVETIGVALPDAIAMATATPAAFLGLHDHGRLAVGCVAEFTMITTDGQEFRRWRPKGLPVITADA